MGADNGFCPSTASCSEQFSLILDPGETRYFFVDGGQPDEEGSYGFSLRLDCEPACDGRECGFEPCTGSCGTCPDGQSCSGAGFCE